MPAALTTPPPSYQPLSGPETAFLKARQVVDEREGSHIRRANHWRLVALGNSALSLVLSAGLIVQSTQVRIEPYVVEIGAGEQVRVVKNAAQSDYQPQAALIKKALADWLIAVRSVSSDPIVVRQNWLNAYHWVTPKGKVQLDAFAQAEDPFALVGKATRSIQQIQVSQLPHTQTYRVEWVERTWSSNGAPQGQPQAYVGTHTLVTLKPKTAQALQDNPLGIYIDGFEWTQLATQDGE